MSADHGLDRLLDRTIVPGYSTIGYRLRRPGWRDDDPMPSSMIGRRVLVTGAASGLGEAAALGLARLGATVHLLARSKERAAPAAGRITEALGRDGLRADVELEECDVSDLEAVRAFAGDFSNRDLALDAVVHNAGVMPAERTTSVDGHELSVATHVLGPVLMTELLLPALERASSGARVVLVSSGGMYAQPVPVDDLEYRNGRYRGATAYARSKRMQVALLPLLAERWSHAGVGVHAMHPGWADTPGVASSLPLFRLLTRPLLRDSAGGADTAVWLAATQPPPPAGQLWHDRVARPTSYRSSTEPTPRDVERQWSFVTEATGLG